jgi:DNA-binding FadR family transcriptional regulator
MTRADQPVLNVRQRSREAADALQRHVLAGIASGKLKAGDRLPTERELAGMFGGGRATVRRVLAEFETQGLIGREVGRGTFVRETTAWAAPATAPAARRAPGPVAPGVAAILDSVAISERSSPADVMELRLMLEPHVIELAVSRASKADIDAMDDCLQQARRARTLEDFEHWDDMLHRSFAAASRNPLCMAIYDLVGSVRREAAWGELKRRTLTEALKKAHFDEHVKIVDAVRARDAMAARRLMQQHLEHIRRNMFGEG